VAVWLFLRASHILALHVEEKGGQRRTIQLLFPFANPYDWLKRGSRSGNKKEYRIDNGIGRAFCPLLKGHVLHPAEVLASTLKWQGL
jgi:hypothetical protein